MTLSSSPISDAELCAFLDGDVGEARHAELAAIVRSSPTLQAKLKIWREQDIWLRAAFAARAHEPVPEVLLQALPTDRAPPFPHEVVAVSPSPARPHFTRAQEVVRWKRISLALSVLLLATALYASGLIPGAPSCASVVIEKWMDQPKSLRGS